MIYHRIQLGNSEENALTFPESEIASIVRNASKHLNKFIEEYYSKKEIQTVSLQEYVLHRLMETDMTLAMLNPPPSEHAHNEVVSVYLALTVGFTMCMLWFEVSNLGISEGGDYVS